MRDILFLRFCRKLQIIKIVMKEIRIEELGLPRSLDDINAELKEAERELSDGSKWTPLCDFISDFKQEHASWLK